MRHVILVFFVFLGICSLLSMFFLDVAPMVGVPLTIGINLVGVLVWHMVRVRQLDALFLGMIRQMGGRITLAQLAERSQRRPSQVEAYLEMKVRRGQAVVSNLESDTEKLYIFEGFINRPVGRFFGSGM